MAVKDKHEGNLSFAIHFVFQLNFWTEYSIWRFAVEGFFVLQKLQNKSILDLDEGSSNIHEEGTLHVHSRSQSQFGYLPCFN